MGRTIARTEVTNPFDGDESIRYGWRRETMKLYRMKYTLTEPSEDTEEKYLAEIPDLPGCRAWGDTAAQALENLQCVATAFVESCCDRGDALPSQVAAVADEVDGRQGFSEVMVAV